MFFISKKKFDDVVRQKVDNALYEQNRDQDIRRRFDEHDRHLWDLDRRVSTLEVKAGIKIADVPVCTETRVG